MRAAGRQHLAVELSDLAAAEPVNSDANEVRLTLCRQTDDEPDRSEMPRRVRTAAATTRTLADTHRYL